MERLRLSPAQKRALLGVPTHRPFKPCHTGFQWPTLLVLKSHYLINGVKDGALGWGPDAPHVVTPKGLRLRAELWRELEGAQ